MASPNPVAHTVQPHPAVRYPDSFHDALQNRFTVEQVDAFSTFSTRPSFFYGSLMLPSVVSSVIDESDVSRIVKNMTPAVLPDHQRYAVMYADFPAILPSEVPGDCVTGILLIGLSKGQNHRIEVYESGLYTLEQVKVEIELCDGSKRLVEADVYVWKDGRNDLIEVQEKLWSIEEFLSSSFYEGRLL
ncbi:MAG: hypothetical protein M1830_008530 [Pleopsidium flavum]|nr:MAG: hypothetical protein M1830_008530 [Pleopsidium flavum]